MHDDSIPWIIPVPLKNGETLFIELSERLKILLGVAFQEKRSNAFSPISLDLGVRLQEGFSGNSGLKLLIDSGSLASKTVPASA